MNHTGVVGVRSEPKHGVLIDNPVTLVYGARIAAGEETLFHRHDEDTWYVSLADATVENTELTSGTTRVQRHAHGATFSMRHRARPLEHRIRCVADGPAHFVGAELRAPRLASAAQQAVLQAHGYVLSERHSGALVYDLVLEPGERTGTHLWVLPTLVVALGAATVGVECTLLCGSLHATGDCVWSDAVVEHDIRNASAVNDLRCKVVQWNDTL